MAPMGFRRKTRKQSLYNKKQCCCNKATKKNEENEIDIRRKQSRYNDLQVDITRKQNNPYGLP